MKRGMWWPIGLAGVLAATVAANIWVAVIANDDPSFAIEPDYYKKAVEWDTTLAQDRHNVALGWRLTPAMSAIAPDGTSLLSAQLTDSTGVAISGAVVRVAALAVARASDVHDMTLAPQSGAGNYAVRFDARRAGEWELRFDATLGGEHFTQMSRVRVSSRAERRRRAGAQQSWAHEGSTVRSSWPSRPLTRSSGSLDSLPLARDDLR